MSITLALLAALAVTDPTPILVTDEYFPVYVDKCGTEEDEFTPPEGLEGVSYEFSTTDDGNMRYTMDPTEGNFLLVEGNQVVFDRPAFTDVPCEIVPVPIVAVPPITTLPATGIEDVNPWAVVVGVSGVLAGLGLLFVSRRWSL